MLTLREAVRIEEILKLAFEDVVMNGSKDSIKIRAKRMSTRIPVSPGCEHKTKIIARNIMACIIDGKLSSDSKSAIKYDAIVYCMGCETVFKAIRNY